MEKIKYKKYSKREMLNIIENMPILFVETSFNNAYVIRKKDLADFIILETQRNKHHIEMEFYMPGINEPVVTTFGWFLNTINPLLREEIIHRLVLLQTTDKKPKKVKVFDTNEFSSMLDSNKLDNKIKNTDKFYQKYEKVQNTLL